MTNNNKIFSKLSFLAIGTGLILLMSGCDNKIEEQQNFNAINKYQEYMKKNEGIILKDLNINKNYKDFIKELTNNTRTSEKEVYELLKTNLIEDKKNYNQNDISIKEKEFAIELFSKKFEFRNKNIEQQKIDKIIKESVKLAMTNDLSFEDMNISTINSIYAITSLLNLDINNSIDIDFENLNLIKIEENFNSKYKTTENISKISSLDFIDIFDTTMLFKSNQSDKNKVLNEINEQIKDIQYDIQSLENSIVKQAKIFEETKQMKFEKEQMQEFIEKAVGLSLENKSKLILMRDYIKILENYIKIVETMEIRNDLEMYQSSQMIPGGGYSHTGGYSARANHFIPFFVSNNSNNINQFSSNRSGGHSGLSSSSSSRGSYGG